MMRQRLLKNSKFVYVHSHAFAENYNGVLQNNHPAVKLVIMASEMQEKEVGDGTNWVLIFAGALLDQAEELLRMVIIQLSSG